MTEPRQSTTVPNTSNTSALTCSSAMAPSIPAAPSPSARGAGVLLAVLAPGLPAGHLAGGALLLELGPRLLEQRRLGQQVGHGHRQRGGAVEDGRVARLRGRR